MLIVGIVVALIVLGLLRMGRVCGFRHCEAVVAAARLSPGSAPCPSRLVGCSGSLHADRPTP